MGGDCEVEIASGYPFLVNNEAYTQRNIDAALGALENEKSRQKAALGELEARREDRQVLLADRAADQVEQRLNFRLKPAPKMLIQR